MGIRERQEREREKMRRTILDAARDLFVAEGYQHVSVRKIAERIEYSPAAIYGYFSGKDELFVALAEEGFELLDAVARGVPEADDPVEALRRSLWIFYEFSKRHPEHFVLMFLDRSVPRIGEHYQRYARVLEMKARMAGIVRRCVATGAFPEGTDCMSAFRVLSSGLLGAAASHLFNRLGPGEDPDALARDVIELGLAGLRAGTAITFRATTACPAGQPDASVPAPPVGSSHEPAQEVIPAERR